MTPSTITICRECYDPADVSHAPVRETTCYRSGTASDRISDAAEQAGYFTSPDYDNLLGALVTEEVYDHGAAGSSISTLADRLGIHRDRVTEAVDRMVRYGYLVTSSGPRGARLAWTAAYGPDVHVVAISLDEEDERLGREMREDYLRRYRRGERKISGRTYDEDVAACLDILRGEAPAQAA